MLSSSYQEELCPGPQLSYSLGMGSDVEEDEAEGDPSPNHALHLWMQEVKSEQSSCLSSRANSVLSLTDTEQERKSDGENGESRPLALAIAVVLSSKAEGLKHA